MRSVTCEFVYERLGLPDAPILLDTRSVDELDRVPHLIPGSFSLDPEVVQDWSSLFSTHRTAVWCAGNRKHATSVVHALGALGVEACSLDGGVDGWVRRRFPTVRVRREFGVPGRSQWVTRERPKIDRLACPWLVRRFIDPTASFFYVPAEAVRADAASLGAEPYDIADVTFSHRGSHCSFDAFLVEFELRDPVIAHLADIVRAADTGTLSESPEAPGLLAISLGLSATFDNDHLLLEQAMPVYDALYAWCKSARDETHSWPQRRSP